MISSQSQKCAANTSNSPPLSKRPSANITNAASAAGAEDLNRLQQMNNKKLFRSNKIMTHMVLESIKMLRFSGREYMDTSSPLLQSLTTYQQSTLILTIQNLHFIKSQLERLELLTTLSSRLH